MITGHTSWYFFARCTKGIVYLIEYRLRTTRYYYGTNFRHAVEFSRSGRTPSRSSQIASGQPMKLYSVSFALSNRHRPLFPLGLTGADNRVARAWGMSGRPRLWRARSQNEENISKPSEGSQNGGCPSRGQRTNAA